MATDTDLDLQGRKNCTFREKADVQKQFFSNETRTYIERVPVYRPLCEWHHSLFLPRPSEAEVINRWYEEASDAIHFRDALWCPKGFLPPRRPSLLTTNIPPGLNQNNYYNICH